MLRLSMLVLLGVLAACAPTITYELDEGAYLSDAIVEASCGQCQLGLEGKGCDLAIRMDDGKSMYVDGSSIDDHGDAHAEDGLCNAVHEAKVSGEIVDGRFVASSFELINADG